MSAFGSFDNKEFEEFAQHVQTQVSSGQFKKEITKSVKNVGIQFKKEAENRTPVKTGQLRRNWELRGPNISGSDISITLANNTEYASFVENGHRQKVGQYVPAIGKRLKASWVPGQHFLEKSTVAISNQIPQLLTPAVWDAMWRLMNK
ncbi:MAG: HK97 gp10 family phage protein [Lactobacillus sp.]|nr:HK97 gp10 family phage protein [Lactobacillus sp.]